ncbi:nucleoside hydrolase [Deinococcus humi]|uniref:Purine nucleosidase n=1 Tax=Deinococcus humi TaxID=662880 RepID=A0A7W8NDS1_9DEIO|nr:nucleoside hydrolase [Deinococcus humi]MBB5363524.1 purine nucleosidase [Deinococcus humi]GGO30384.1 nucleoside hydrolase [Deinococcus humi]
MRKFIIDTDTGSDDAVALVMALRDETVDVLALTIVAGNVPMKQGAQNALYTVELCGRTTPVYEGLAAPIMRPLQTAQFVHGEDGMGDLGLPLFGRVPADGHAVDILIDTINRFPGEITLVTLGPLSNVALALLRDPSIAGKLHACYVMGGVGQGPGNITPVGEYNIWADPEAADIVFSAGLPLTMIGWDVSWKYATFAPDDVQRLREIGTPLAHFCVDIQAVLDVWAKENTDIPGFDLPDPIAMAVALDERIATTIRERYVKVETHSELCRGQTMVDHLRSTQQPPNTRIVLDADRDRFMAMLHRAVAPSLSPA